MRPCAEQSDDLCCAEENAGDQHDIHQPPREIVEFAAEDQHAAGNGDSGERDEAGNRAGDRFLDLLERPLPWQAAARTGERRGRHRHEEQRNQKSRYRDRAEVMRHDCPRRFANGGRFRKSRRRNR